MRIVFMGTPDFAAGSLEAVIEAGHDVAAAVTGEDKPVGRGNKVQMCAVKQVAVQHNIPVLQPHRVRGNDEFLEQLKSLHPDIIIVAAYGKIIPKEILELPEYGCINVHASLLPDYRGAAPIQWAVIDGREVSGVTIMQMDEGLDTGDMVAVKEIKLAPDETGGSLFERLSRAGAELLVETLDRIAEGTTEPVPQPEESPTPYARMIRKEDGLIDWSEPAVKIERLIRGLNPWPSAYTGLDGKMLKIWAADVVEDNAADVVEDNAADAAEDDAAMEHIPGTVFAIGNKSFSVQTGNGALRIRELQLAGKKRMDAGAFLRGFHLQEGTVLK